MAKERDKYKPRIYESPLSTEERLALFDQMVAEQMERQKNNPSPPKEPLTQEYVDDIYNDELRAYAQQVLDHPDWTPEQYAAALESTPERIFILTQWLNRGWTRDELYERGRSSC